MQRYNNGVFSLAKCLPPLGKCGIVAADGAIARDRRAAPERSAPSARTYDRKENHGYCEKSCEEVCEEAGRTKEDGSPNMLRIIRAKKSGKRFVGCTGWTADDPESCDQTFPLPQRGDVFRLEDRCSICEQTPRLKVVPFRGRPWNLCLNDDCESMQEMKKRRAEREAAKAAKAAMEKQPKPSGDEDATPAKAKASKADTATRGRKRAKAGAKG